MPATVGGIPLAVSPNTHSCSSRASIGLSGHMDKENNRLFIGTTSMVGNMCHCPHRVRHAAVLSPPLYFLLPFVLLCFSSPALTSRLPLLCLSAGFPAPIVMCHAQRMVQSGYELPDWRVRILSVFAFWRPPHHLAQRPGDILVSSGV